MPIGVHSVALPSVLQIVCLRLSFHSLPPFRSPSLTLLPSFRRSVAFLSSYLCHPYIAFFESEAELRFATAELGFASATGARIWLVCQSAGGLGEVMPWANMEREKS